MKSKLQDVDFDFVAPTVSGKYTGEYNQNGQKHGSGEMQYQDGSKYQGNWSNDLYEGTGVFTNQDGIKLVGVWQQG